MLLERVLLILAVITALIVFSKAAFSIANQTFLLQVSKEDPVTTVLK